MSSNPMKHLFYDLLSDDRNLKFTDSRLCVRARAGVNGIGRSMGRNGNSDSDSDSGRMRREEWREGGTQRKLKEHPFQNFVINSEI